MYESYESYKCSINRTFRMRSDRREKQDDQSASWKTEAATAGEMNEEHRVENGQ